MFSHLQKTFSFLQKVQNFDVILKVLLICEGDAHLVLTHIVAVLVLDQAAMWSIIYFPNLLPGILYALSRAARSVIAAFAAIP